jgi:hypothetical protein
LQLATVLRGDSGALVCCSSRYFGILYLSLLFLDATARDIRGSS